MKKSIVGLFILTILTTGTFSFSSSIVDLARVEASTNTTSSETQVRPEQSEAQPEQQEKQQPQEEEQQVAIPNHRPNANAGPDKKVGEGNTVILDARGSSDPDKGNKITYLWKQVAGRPQIKLGLSSDASTASFTAPSIDRDTILTYAVTVTDDKRAQDRDTVRVSIDNTNTGVNTLDTDNSNNLLNNTTANALSNAQRNNNNNNINNLSRLDAVATGDANTQFSPSSVSTLAVISGTVALQTNNIVNTRSYYDVLFRTGTSANINKIEVTFPAGTNIGSVRILEVSGVPAGGGVSKSGQTVTYTIPSSPLVPANTVIRMGYANIINPATAGSSFSVQIATKDSGGGIIDSGTSVSYAIKQIGTGDIADNAITSAKIGLAEVGPNDISNNAITTTCPPGLACTSKLADNAVVNSKIANDAVTGNKIAPGAVGAVDIIDGSIGSADIGPDAVGTSQITTNGVGGPEIIDGSVGAADIGANAVGTSEIADQSIGSVDIGANSVGASEIVGVDKLIFGSCIIDWGDVGPDDVDVFDCPFPGAVVGDLVLVQQGFLNEQDIFVSDAFIFNAGAVRIVVQSTADIDSHNPGPATYSIMVYHIG